MKHLSYGSSVIVVILLVFVLWNVSLHLPSIAWWIIGYLLLFATVGYIVGTFAIKLYAQYRVETGATTKKAPVRRVASPRKDVKE